MRELYVPGDDARMTALPPSFLHEVPQQLRNNPPVDEILTGLPYIDLEN